MIVAHHENTGVTQPHQQPITICPKCQCRELFVRKDFPQKLGMGIVIVAGIIATILFAGGYTLWALATLFATAVIDAGVYLFTGRVLVCYRCRAEFRGVTLTKDQQPWDLATGEKYQQHVKMAQNREGNTSN